VSEVLCRGTVTEVLLGRYYLLEGTVSEVLCRGTVREVLMMEVQSQRYC